MNRIERNWTNKHKNTIGLTAGLVSNARVLQTSDFLAVSSQKDRRPGELQRLVGVRFGELRGETGDERRPSEDALDLQLPAVTIDVAGRVHSMDVGSQRSGARPGVRTRAAGMFDEQLARHARSDPLVKKSARGVKVAS